MADGPAISAREQKGDARREKERAPAIARSRSFWRHRQDSSPSAERHLSEEEGTKVTAFGQWNGEVGVRLVVIGGGGGGERGWG